MQPGGQITGTVTDASTHTAVQDVAVEVLDASGDFVNTACTASDGSYSVPGLNTGSYEVEFADQSEELPERLASRFPNAELVQSDATFTAWVTEVLRLIEVPSRGLDLPLDIQGTAFQQRVWKALQAIPAGNTATYAEVAKRMGRSLDSVKKLWVRGLARLRRDLGDSL